MTDITLAQAQTIVSMVRRTGRWRWGLGRVGRRSRTASLSQNRT